MVVWLRAPNACADFFHPCTFWTVDSEIVDTPWSCRACTRNHASDFCNFISHLSDKFSGSIGIDAAIMDTVTTNDESDSFEDALEDVGDLDTETPAQCSNSGDVPSVKPCEDREFDVLLAQDSGSQEATSDSSDSEAESEQSWTQAAEEAIAAGSGDQEDIKSKPRENEAVLNEEKERIVIEEEEIRKKEALLSPEEIEVSYMFPFILNT